MRYGTELSQFLRSFSTYCFRATCTIMIMFCTSLKVGIILLMLNISGSLFCLFSILLIINACVYFTLYVIDEENRP